ncbi:MAG: hypothetical protein JWN88_1251 [Frankiales bacterium]|nr:hypothetical protein [Frankiales bacterium]
MRPLGSAVATGSRWLAAQVILRRAAVAALLLTLVACSGDEAPAPAADAAPVAPGASAAAAQGGGSSTLWLCRPGLPANPCEGGLDATVVDGKGTVEPFTPAGDPEIDCFYVYPTVSKAVALNAPMAVDADIVATARAQVARFSSECRVFAPVYRQITTSAIFQGRYEDANGRGIAERDVQSAWKEYLANDNDGRGVVLIGHSQGARTLTALLARNIEKDPGARERLVSALLLGGDVTVAAGKDVGGSFTDVPACRTVGQAGCVVAYSSFLGPPPSDSFFGRAKEAGREVLCVDPTKIAGGDGTLHPYLPSDKLAPGATLSTAVPGLTTGFAAFPGQLKGECRSEGGASFLQVAAVPGSRLPVVDGPLGPRWGLHNGDVNLALGDLVEVVRKQAATYAAS